MRAEMKEVVAKLRADGDGKLYYIDGLSLFGSELVEFLPDRLHPDGEGHRRLAKNFEQEAFSLVTL